jgi:hypothetical protein
MHTFVSDGSMSIDEIIEKAKQRDVKIVAITDHNRLDTWEEFKEKAAKEGLIPIRGVEINTKHKDKVLHLLAYGFNDDEGLFGLIDQANREMKRRNHDLLEHLARDYEEISIEGYRAYNYNRRKLGWKLPHYMLDRGVVSTLPETFPYYRKYPCNFGLYDFPALGELCVAIKGAGGYSVLAHPSEYYGDLGREDLVKVLKGIREEGVQGIECYYPSHSKLMTETCLAFCKEHGMLITVGGDEHGGLPREGKPDKSIGCMHKRRDEVDIEVLLEGAGDSPR